MTDFGVDTVVLDLAPLSAAFTRRLREAGVSTTPAQASEFARALDLVRPVSRRRLYWTARAVLVTDTGQLKAFDRVFFSVFGGQQSFDPDEVRSAPEEDRLAKTARGTAPNSSESSESAELEVPVAMASDEERLASKSFDALEPHELAQLYRLMSRLQLATPIRRTRRHEKAHHGQRIHMRRTLRNSLRTGGDPVRLARTRRRERRRRLVLLCDISGSMEPYARAYLQFLASAAGSGPGVEAFVFATRLTRLTRALASRHPERAIERAAAAAPDWSSGTRIGDALKAFNDRHGRRGMARGAVVVILSDGWERGNPALVSREMERLSRLAHRIVWVNPRVSSRAFSVQAGGMTAALPHCDALVSGHSFEALAEVAEAIGARTWDRPEAVEPVEEDEPWASATPVPGSSVAMPSGYGPSKGRTTPGWTTE